MRKSLVGKILAAACVGLLIGCNGASSPTKQAPAPVKTGTWAGEIDNVYLAQVHDTVNHRFYLDLWSDNSYVFNDTLMLHALGMKLGTSIEKGSYAKSGAVYTLTPSYCADQATGQLTDTTCRQTPRMATESGDTITLVQYFMGVVNVVLVKH